MTSPGRDHGGSGSGACSKRENPGCCSGWRWCSSCARQAGGSRHCCSRSRRAPHDGRGPVRPPGPAVRAARTTRPGRSHGANATCQRAPRAPPRRAHPLLHLPPRDRTPPASSRGAREAGCGTTARSPPAAGRRPAGRSSKPRGTSPGPPSLPRASSPGAATVDGAPGTLQARSRHAASRAGSSANSAEVVDVAQIGRAEPPR